MSSHVSLSPRDRSLLRLLSYTPATTSLLLRASATFEGGAFADERRLRERLQALAEAGHVRSWSTAQAGGGLMNYYKLTPQGFELLLGPEATKPSRVFFAEVSPSSFAHTFRLAEAIVETLRGCHVRRVTVERFVRENELTPRHPGHLPAPTTKCGYRRAGATRGRHPSSANSGEKGERTAGWQVAHHPAR